MGASVAARFGRAASGLPVRQVGAPSSPDELSSSSGSAGAAGSVFRRGAAFVGRSNVLEGGRELGPGHRRLGGGERGGEAASGASAFSGHAFVSAAVVPREASALEGFGPHEAVGGADSESTLGRFRRNLSMVTRDVTHRDWSPRRGHPPTACSQVGASDLPIQSLAICQSA